MICCVRLVLAATVAFTGCAPVAAAEPKKSLFSQCDDDAQKGKPMTPACLELFLSAKPVNPIESLPLKDQLRLLPSKDAFTEGCESNCILDDPIEWPTVSARGCAMGPGLVEENQAVIVAETKKRLVCRCTGDDCSLTEARP